MEYRIIHGSKTEVQMKLNQWNNDYTITIEHVHVHNDPDQLFITILLLRERR